MHTKNNSELASNRKAFHDYEVLETFEAGIALLGTEIKSLRTYGASLQEAYIDFRDDELWLLNCHIAPYSHGNLHNHPERRPRKLLLHRQEISKIHKHTQEKGRAIVPLSIFLKKGLAKVKIALAKGKKSYDKRAAIKEKEHKQAIQRALKES